jgi:hypothetical protein
VNEVEARSLIDEQLASYRARGYADLATLVGQTIGFEQVTPSGTEYNVEIVVVWDSLRVGGALRVMVTVDDGRWPAWFRPLSGDFILAPDGSFVGE